MISVVLQYVLGFTCPNESMLIGLFRQTQFADERKWLFVSADVSGAGTRDEPLRTSAWEAKAAFDSRASKEESNLIRIKDICKDVTYLIHL